MGTDGSTLELRVYDNGDHTCLVWLTPDAKPIPSCRGFTLMRVKNGVTAYLHGVVGFSDTDTLDPQNPWKFPLQRYLWWDYLVKIGDTVQYSVVPVVGPDKDHLTLDTTMASPLTPAMTITGQSTPHVSAYFNKGIVAAQWVSRALDATPKGSKIKTLVATAGNPLRNELSGLLRPQILSMLADAKAQNGKIFAALYELNDPELIPALAAFGPDCNLILGNGAFSEQKPDENADVRAQLRANTKINVFDRMVSEGHFAHNKFVVFCDSAGNPVRVLTGSTNWTTSGLCTQANNGLVIDDPNVAADYLAAWKRIQAAGNLYSKDLVTGNSTASTTQVDGGTVTPWFVATSDAQDLDYGRNLIKAAKDGILFLFFNPGGYATDPHKWTLLQTVLARQQQGDPTFDQDLYVRGVVNQEIAGLTEPATPPAQATTAAAAPPTGDDGTPVTLYSSGTEPPKQLTHDVLVPHNIKTQFHDWEQELLGASMVNIHSKVIVLDPFGDNPVVMTGSHNLGFKASNANDDNLVIIQGNGPLAAAYAINIIAIYDTYRWNSYVEAHRADPNVWHGLVDNDAWQDEYLTGEHLAEINFWLGHDAASKPAATSVRTVSSH
jgi:phosphatidylserine/phosphatidylglycerophosphate/cardiolipin synthase-like enzyme